MKKCDVEISVTSDTGEKHETMRVPPCLQDDDEESEHVLMSPGTVRLPYRYVQIIGHNKNGQTNPNMNNDLDSREKDLSTALKWIKQEIMQMKEQDKSLMRQFINLRSTIVQLRYMFEFHSSNSDVSSIGGSNISLDEIHKSTSPPRSHHFLSPSDFFDNSVEFRARTSSLLTPKRTPVTRIKWKSNEFL